MVGGQLELSWVRRSRLGYGWSDDVDAPLGESRERYRATVDSPSASFEIETSTPAATIGPAQLATLGSGPAIVSVVMVGDRAISRPATLAITV
jgi:hypothetical protein